MYLVDTYGMVYLLVVLSILTVKQIVEIIQINIFWILSSCKNICLTLIVKMWRYQVTFTSVYFLNQYMPTNNDNKLLDFNENRVR